MSLVQEVEDIKIKNNLFARILFYKVPLILY